MRKIATILIISVIAVLTGVSMTRVQSHGVANRRSVLQHAAHVGIGCQTPIRQGIERPHVPRSSAALPCILVVTTSTPQVPETTSPPVTVVVTSTVVVESATTVAPTTTTTGTGTTLYADFGCIADWETGDGSPGSMTNDPPGNGYSGYLQFTESSWDEASGLSWPASNYSWSVQEQAAEKWIAMCDYDWHSQWPISSRRCGL